MNTLEDWLDIASAKVKRNVEIVTPEQLGQAFLLHVSTNNGLKSFTPRIGLNQHTTEDRTVPRICTAPTIEDCLMGYLRAGWEFLNQASDGTPKSNGYKGGLVIYSFDFEEALRPNKALVYDAEDSNEHWLVTYNKETVQYRSEPVGKIFCQSIKFVGKSGSIPSSVSEIYIEVTKREGLPFTKEDHLTQGYWKITAYEEATLPGKIKKVNPKKPDIQEVSASEYQSAKRACADLLSHVDNIPSYLSW